MKENAISHEAQQCAVKRPVMFDQKFGAISAQTHEWRMVIEDSQEVMFCVHCAKILRGRGEIDTHHSRVLGEEREPAETHVY